MSIAEVFKSAFSTRTRDRGRAYFNAGRVRLSDVDANYVEAEVSGSRHTPYSVEIDWVAGGDGAVDATCTCPHYEDGNLCKHIWATLLTIDRDGIASHLPNRLAAILHQHDEELDEEEDNDWNAAWDDDEPDVLTGILDRLGYRGASSQSSQRQPPPPVWQRQLKLISDHATTAAAAEPIAPLSTDKQRQAWFVLNVGESLASGQLVVYLRQREAKKNGEFGKIKKLSVQRNEIPKFADKEDGRLVELLIGNQTSDESVYSRYDYQGYQMVSRVAVSPTMCDVLLPRLCATGRFVWQVDSSLPADEGRPFTWDDGDPWRFRLHAEDDDGQQLWQLSGDVFRGAESVQLADVVLLMAGGVVLFPDKAARLNVSQADFGWIASLRAQPVIEVPYADRDRLLDMLYGLPQVPEIELPAALQVEQIQGTPRGRLEIKSPEGPTHYARNQLYANVHFVYGDHQFGMKDQTAGRFVGEDNRALLRDRQRETELLAQLAGLGLRPTTVNDYSSRENDLSFPQKRLPDVVYKLTAEDWIVESQGVRIRQPGSFNLSVTSGVDWFELDGQVDFDGVTASLPVLLKALRNKEKYIRLDDGSQGMLPEKWLEKYGYLAEMAKADDDSLRFAPSQAMLLDALLAEQENVHVDRKFTAFRGKLRNFGGIKPYSEPRGFHGKLREYQKEGLGWMHFLREFRLGGCLADDMGLGKTVQVLALLQSRRLCRLKKGESRKPSIVVVPKSLVFNWIDEAVRFTPNLRTLDYTGTDRKDRFERSGGCDLLVTTYGTLRRDVVALKEMHFDYAILDESQAVKNHNSQAAKAVRLLHADHRLAMTGTPIENHLGELWSLFEFLNPGMLGRSTKFNALTRNGKDDNGSLSLLARALRPFLLRRTKDRVLTELPQKTEQTLHCEMSPKQRKAYDNLRDYYRVNLSDRVKELGLKKAKIHVLEALLRLRQAACHPGLLDKKQTKVLSPKLETLLEQLREVIAEGHKALVFSQFTSLLAIVRQHLDDEKIVYEYLDGRTRKRAARVKRFQTDPACPLFLISLKAGGHGLNLTAADYVFILDPWWNPAVEAQAIDRVHRIGQTRRVFAYRIICTDTVEDKILELQRSKRDLADAIISANGSFVRNLTTEDLQLLLS
ncbi:MAG: DEAD/DEAH box helicase [Candidatus Nealsonbacteria bacterium]|nr:DEAD/DEAH box helicase [Candidatus Nealsonbacteria bacterium]